MIAMARGNKWLSLLYGGLLNPVFYSFMGRMRNLRGFYHLSHIQAYREMTLQSSGSTHTQYVSEMKINYMIKLYLRDINDICYTVCNTVTRCAIQRKEDLNLNL